MEMSLSMQGNLMQDLIVAVEDDQSNDVWLNMGILLYVCNQRSGQRKDYLDYSR